MAISISDVTSNLTTTNGVVTGDGAFDDLMEAVNTQLKNQFDLGRITGTDYANVYLGAMQFAIQNAVQFTLTKGQTDAQTDGILSDTINKKLTTKAELYISEQKLISEKITNGEEINQYIWEIEYAEDPDNTYTFTTIQNLTENDVISLRNFDPHVAGYTVQSVVLNQVTNIRTAGTSLAEVSIQKAEGEVAVLAQKEVTEYAQTEKTDKSAPTSTSIMGRQGSLYEKQANGFEWDAKNTHNKNTIDYEKALILNDGTLTPGFSITNPTS